MPSNITTSITPDSPVSLAANYQLTAADRRRIDDQIVGMQRHLAQGLLRGQTRSFFKLAADSVSLAKGDLFCVAAVEVDETDANTAVRTVTRADSIALTASGVVLGIAATPASPGATFQGITDGIVGRAITGLASGAAGAVRANSARCQRVASFGGSDYAVGFVDAVGNLTLSQTAAGAAVGGGASLSNSNPVGFASANPGVAVEAARIDHVHPRPANATTSVDGYHSATDKTNHNTMWNRAVFVNPTGNATTDTNALNNAAALARTNHYAICLGQGQFNVNDDELQWHNLYGTEISGVGCAQASSSGTITDGTTIKFTGTRRAGSVLVHMNSAFFCSVRGIHFKAGDEASPNATVETLLECGIGNRAGGTTPGGFTYPAEIVRQPTFNTFYDCHFTGVLAHAATSTTSQTLSATSISFAGVTGTWPTSSHVLVRSAGGDAIGYGTVSSFSGGTLTIAFSYVRNNGAPAAHTDWRIHAISNGLSLPLPSNTLVRQCRMSGLFWFADVSGSNATKILSCAMDSDSAFGPQIVGSDSSYGLRVENFITEPGVDGWNCHAKLDTVFGAYLNFVNGDAGNKGNCVELNGSVDVTIDGGALYSTSTDALVFSNGTEGLTFRNVNASGNGAAVDFRGTSPSKYARIDLPKYGGPKIFEGEASTHYQSLIWRGADGVQHHSDSLEGVKMYSIFGVSVPIENVNLTSGVDVVMQTAYGHATSSGAAHLYGFVPASDIGVYNYLTGTLGALPTPAGAPRATIIHDGNFTLTIHNDNVTETVASWRVLTGTGADVVVPACTGGKRYILEFLYYPSSSRWLLESVSSGIALNSGDAAGGDLTGTYPNPTIANTAVTSAKLAADAVVDVKVAAAAAIAGTKISPNFGSQDVQTSGLVKGIKAVNYAGYTDNGNSGTAKTIDLGTSAAQKLTLTGNCTLTFTAPAAMTAGVLRVAQNGTGGFSLTFPTAYWPDGTAAGGQQPSLGANDVTIYDWFYDGTNYYIVSRGKQALV